MQLWSEKVMLQSHESFRVVDYEGIEPVREAVGFGMNLVACLEDGDVGAGCAGMFR